VTHLLEDAERVADRIVFVKEGLATAQGTLDELRDRFRRARFRLAASAPLEKAASELVGVRLAPPEPDGPPNERVLHFEGSDDPARDAGLLAEVERRSGATLLDSRRMTLREIYFAVLSNGVAVTT
jgi:ABC-type multidrug transport system ATPase subunit